MAKTAKKTLRKKPHGQTRALKNYMPGPAKEEPDELKHARENGQASFEAIAEMVADLAGHEKAATEEGWTGPHKDKFGATYYEDATGEKPVTYCAGSWKELCEAFDIEAEESDEARQTISEDPLSIQVRSGWYAPPGASKEDRAPVEYEILLSTGGPASRIVGELSEHNEPETAELQVQDWFQPWTTIAPAGVTRSQAQDILLTYARCFYFGD